VNESTTTRGGCDIETHSVLSRPFWRNECIVRQRQERLYSPVFVPIVLSEDGGDDAILKGREDALERGDSC
jgi:hypothetical protein